MTATYSAHPGRRLRSQRLAAGLTQRDVAIRTPCAESYVRRLETGFVPSRSRVLPDILRVLAEAEADRGAAT